MVTANNVVGGVYTGWSRMDLARRFTVFVNADLASYTRSAATQSGQIREAVRDAQGGCRSCACLLLRAKNKGRTTFPQRLQKKFGLLDVCAVTNGRQRGKNGHFATD